MTQERINDDELIFKYYSLLALPADVSVACATQVTAISKEAVGTYASPRTIRGIQVAPFRGCLLFVVLPVVLYMKAQLVSRSKAWLPDVYWLFHKVLQ